MDAEHLIGTLIRGALGGGRKRSDGALRFLTGGRHSLLNAGTLLTAAGVAWGLYETATRTRATVAGGRGRRARAGRERAHAARCRRASAAGASEPQVRRRMRRRRRASETGGTDAVSAASVSPDVLRVIRLTIAAARADGTLTAKEEDAILTHARTVGSRVARRAGAPNADAAAGDHRGRTAGAARRSLHAGLRRGAGRRDRLRRRAHLPGPARASARARCRCGRRNWSAWP